MTGTLVGEERVREVVCIAPPFNGPSYMGIGTVSVPSANSRPRKTKGRVLTQAWALPRISR